MSYKEVGTPLAGGVPKKQEVATNLRHTNNSALKQNCKPLLSGGWNHPVTKAQLQTYLDLGLYADSITR